MVPNMWLCAVDETAWMHSTTCKEAQVWTPIFVLESTSGTGITVWA